MRYRLLDIVYCPKCHGSLALESFSTIQEELNIKLRSDQVQCSDYCHLRCCVSNQVESKECADCYGWNIRSGKLTCKNCHAEYPIINGVPRLLKKELLRESIREFHSEFISQYGTRFKELDSLDLVEQEKLNTIRAFSYQWHNFLNIFEYYRKMFSTFLHPFLSESDFQGKLVLDVGCGSGRPTLMAASLGAEVVAIDISESVEVIEHARAQFPLVHVVQGDACNLPFKSHFDFAYSIGVLQHIPGPTRAVGSIASVLKSGQIFYAWVYAKRELWYRPIDFMRIFTRKMPLGTLMLFSYFMAAASEILFLTPFRVMSKLRFLKGIADKIPGRHYSQFPFRENVLGWFDRLGAPVTAYFTEAELIHMFESSGFEKLTLYKRPGASASFVLKAARR